MAIDQFRPPAPDRPHGDGEAALNPQQLEVVRAGDGPVLVIAGAGSGKTRAVTHRVAHLLARGVAAERLLLLTFTNKAAREMLQRVAELVPADAGRVWGGTFHGVANRILRQHGEPLGYGRDFSILDRADALDLLDVARTAIVADVGRELPAAERIATLASLAVNTRRSLVDVIGDREPAALEQNEEIERVVGRYRRDKLRANAMDFDDLLANLLLVLDDPASGSRWSTRFEYVLVDEYQDTNRLQAEIVDRFAAGHRNVMVVGDDEQSIYSFRGAAHANILDFPSRYPDTRLLKLEINYRSTPEILSLANAAIAANQRKHDKRLIAARASGSLPVVATLHDAVRQATFVASRIADLRADGDSLGEIAVLYRSHFHSLELQMQLARHGIPYEVRSGGRLFESAHVKDALAHLRLVANPRDVVAWKRVLRLLPQVGERTAERIVRDLEAHAQPLAAVVTGMARPKIPKLARAGWTRLCELLAELTDSKGDPGAMLRVLLAGSYIEYLFASYDNAEARLEELHQLAQFAQGFADVAEFLSELALATDADAATTAGVADGRVVLTTVHQAKGLEWNSVFVIWLTEGRFPSARSLDEDPHGEEERRLFYVAITRARDHLHLSYPCQGRDEYRQRVPFRASRFLLELPSAAYEAWELYEPDLAEYDPEANRSRSRRGREDDAIVFDDGPFLDGD